MLVNNESDSDYVTDALLLSSQIIRWATDAMHAMSKVAPDATRFETLQDRWDEIEKKSGHIIRDLLTGRSPGGNSILAYAEGVSNGGKQGHAVRSGIVSLPGSGNN